MVRKLEKRSARILALLLTFIMLGSVFAYVSGGGTREKRETKLSLSASEIVGYLPENSLIYYYNLTEINALSRKLGDKDPLVAYVGKIASQELNYAYNSYLDRRIVEFTSNIQEFLVARYGDFDVYIVNENASKVYFAKQAEQKMGNFTVKLYGSVAIADEVHPLLVGYNSLVLEVIERIDKEKPSDYSTYISRLNGTFLFYFMTFGNLTGKYVRFTEGNESPADFFFQGFRFNETSGNYEKVWGIHFIQNYFFSGVNESEKGFEYYYFENFDDGFSIAIMGDKNFTAVENAIPNVVGIIIS